MCMIRHAVKRVLWMEYFQKVFRRVATTIQSNIWWYLWIEGSHCTWWPGCSVPTSLPISPQLTSASHLHSQRRFCLLASIAVVSVSVVMLHCCGAAASRQKTPQKKLIHSLLPIIGVQCRNHPCHGGGVKPRGNPSCIYPLHVCKTCLHVRDLPSHPRWYERVRLCSSAPPPAQCRDLGTIWASDHLCLCHPGVPRKWDIFPSATARLCSDHWSTSRDCDLQSRMTLY